MLAGNAFGPGQPAQCEGAHGKRIQIFAGNAHPELAHDVAKILKVDVSPAEVKKFKCGETSVIVNKSVRDDDVFVIQPTCNPDPNDYLMELLIMMDAFRRAGAGRITAVVPIFGCVYCQLVPLAEVCCTCQCLSSRCLLRCL